MRQEINPGLLNYLTDHYTPTEDKVMVFWTFLGIFVIAMDVYVTGKRH